MGIVARLKKNIALLKRSWSKKDFLFSFGSDVLALLLVVGFAFAFLLPLQGVSTDLANNYSDMQAQLDLENPNTALLTSQQSEMISQLTMMISFLILFFLSVVASIVGTRLFIWRRLTKMKAPSELFRRRIKRYMVLFLFTVVVVGVLGGILYALMQAGIVSTDQLEIIKASKTKLFSFKLFLEILIPLALFIGVSFQYIYTKTSKIFVSLRDAFGVVTRLFSFFIIPYLIVRFIFILRLPFFYLFNAVVTLAWANFILKLIIALLIVSVARLYFNKLLAVLYKRYTIEAKPAN